MTQSEDTRQEFLIKNRGIKATAQWYRDTANYYAMAAERALWPMENVGKLKIARGKEWASLYEKAAEDCLQRARNLSGWRLWWSKIKELWAE